MRLEGCRNGVRRSLTRGAAIDTAARALMPRLSFFFFFFFWDSCRLGSDFLQNGPIWPESGRIGRIKLYWPTTEIGLESCLNNRNRL